MGTKPWQSFFDQHSSRYDSNAFTFATEAECDFLSNLIPLGTHRRILDVGCGTGRHSIGLSAKGYEVTGIDISEGMLEKARRKAGGASSNLRFVRTDATGDFPEKLGMLSSFDTVICLCEGSMGLIGSGDHPMDQALSLFGNFAKVLRPGGLLILTALNALKPARQYSVKDIEDGRYDPLMGVEWHPLSEVDPAFTGDLGKALVGEKSFTGAELWLLLKMTGFALKSLSGGTAGNWGFRQLDPDEYEIMAVAVRD